MSPYYFGREITSDNARGLCSDEFCGKEYSHYIKIVINGLACVVPFCKRHIDEIEEVGL